MELVYIWVEKYECFENRGFNFNAKHYFEFDSENKILSYHYQDGNIERFFDYDQNIDVLAVVGNNGSGKTTFLELLFNNLNGENSIKSKRIFIFKSNKEDKFCIYYLPFSDVSTKITLKTADKNLTCFNLKKGIIINNIGECELLNQSFVKATNNIYIIYLSNTFDNRYYSYEKRGNISDISTTALIKSNAKIKKELKFLNPIMDVNIEYFYQEFSNQINFITSYKNFNKFLPFDLPKESFVKLGSIDYLQDSLFKLIDNEEVTDKITHIFKYVYRENVSDINYFKNEVIKRMLILLLNDYCHIPTQRNREILPQEIVISIQKVKTKDSLWKTIKALVLNIKKELQRNNIHSHAFADSYIEFIDWIEINENLIGDFKYVQIDNIFKIPTEKSENFVGIQEFFDKYRYTAKIVEYLNFSWGLSTGENTLLSLFSRLFTLCKKQNEKYYLLRNEKIQNNAMLLIDEADLTFHPSWQQKYLYLLIAYVKDIYSNCKIKIVIATHSPIILSDIPKQNVIFLKNEDDIIKVENSQDHAETFAANISTLFYDSFFMKKGSIGKFAKSIINDIIDRVKPHSDGKAPTLQMDEERKLRQKINIIGDDVLRNKLNEMLDNCTIVSKDIISQIKKIDEQIKDLEAQKRKLQGDI